MEHGFHLTVIAVEILVIITINTLDLVLILNYNYGVINWLAIIYIVCIGNLIPICIPSVIGLSPDVVNRRREITWFLFHNIAYFLMIGFNIFMFYEVEYYHLHVSFYIVLGIFTTLLRGYNTYIFCRCQVPYMEHSINSNSQELSTLSGPPLTLL